MCINNKFLYAVIEKIKSERFFLFIIILGILRKEIYTRKSYFNVNIKKLEFAVDDILNILPCAVQLELYGASVER